MQTFRTRFTTDISQHQRAMRQFRSNTGDAIAKVRNQLMTLGTFSIGGMGLLEASKSVLSLAGDMEKTKVAFTVMLGSAEKAKAVLGDLTKFADITPFQTGEIIAAGRALISCGVAAGSLRDRLDLLGNIAAGTNMTITDMVSIYAKMANKGKVHTEELNQMAERGIPIYKTLCDMLNIQQGELAKMTESGKLSFGLIEEALEKLGGKGGQYFGLIAKQSRTMSGLFSTLQGNVSMLATEFGELLIPELSAYLADIIAKLEEMKKSGELTQYMRELADGIISVLKAVVELASFLAKNKDTLFAAGKVIAVYYAWTKVNSALSMTGNLINSLGKADFSIKGLRNTSSALKYLTADLRTLSRLQGKLVTSLGAIGAAAAVAFTGWEIGKCIGQMLDLENVFTKLLLKAQGMSDIEIDGYLSGKSQQKVKPDIEGPDLVKNALRKRQLQKEIAELEAKSRKAGRSDPSDRSDKSDRSEIPVAEDQTYTITGEVNTPDVPVAEDQTYTVTGNLTAPDVPVAEDQQYTVTGKVNTPDVPVAEDQTYTVTGKANAPDVPVAEDQQYTVTGKANTPDVPVAEDQQYTVTGKANTPDVPEVEDQQYTVTGEVNTPDVPVAEDQQYTVTGKVIAPEIPKVKDQTYVITAKFAVGESPTAAQQKVPDQARPALEGKKKELAALEESEREYARKMKEAALRREALTEQIRTKLNHVNALVAKREKTQKYISGPRFSMRKNPEYVRLEQEIAQTREDNLKLGDERNRIIASQKQYAARQKAASAALEQEQKEEAKRISEAEKWKAAKEKEAAEARIKLQQKVAEKQKELKEKRRQIAKEQQALADEQWRDLMSEKIEKWQKNIEQYQKQIDETEKKLQKFGASVSGNILKTPAEIAQERKDEILRKKIASYNEGKKVHFSDEEKKRIATLQAEQLKARKAQQTIFENKGRIEGTEKRIDARERGRKQQDWRERSQNLAERSNAVAAAQNTINKINDGKKPVQSYLDHISALLNSRLPKSTV